MVSNRSKVNKWKKVLGTKVIEEVLLKELERRFGTPETMKNADGKYIRWVTTTKNAMKIRTYKGSSTKAYLCEILSHWKSKPGYKVVRYKDLATHNVRLGEFKSTDVDL